MRAFKTIVNDGRVFRYGWLVKADPDAVFFPGRLKLHLQGKEGTKGTGLYIINCKNEYGGALYGSLEVFSRNAIRSFKLGLSRCRKLHWWHWGEDYFMQRCLDLLAVGRIFDYELVGDPGCHWAPCTDNKRVAFHPYKDKHSYFDCWKQARRTELFPGTADHVVTQRHAITARAGGVCCFAARDQDDMCGSCYPDAMAQKSSWCASSSERCQKCGGGMYKWCKELKTYAKRRALLQDHGSWNISNLNAWTAAREEPKAMMT